MITLQRPDVPHCVLRIKQRVLWTTREIAQVDQGIEGWVCWAKMEITEAEQEKKKKKKDKNQ